MQPVQDLTVEDRVSRTQFQYTLEDPNADELNTYAPATAGRNCKSSRNCATWLAISRCSRSAGPSDFRSSTASRLGITHVRHRSDALRFVRPAPSLHHLHAVESVSRGAGGEAAVRRQSAGPQKFIYPHRARRAAAQSGLVAGGTPGGREQRRTGSSATAASQHAAAAGRPGFQHAGLRSDRVFGCVFQTAAKFR